MAYKGLVSLSLVVVWGYMMNQKHAKHDRWING